MTAPPPQHPRRIIRHKKKKPRKRITGAVDILSSCAVYSGTLYQAVRRVRRRSPVVFVVLIEENKLPSSNMGVTDPLLPSGTPPPLGIEYAPPKMRDLLLSFTTLAGRGGRLDAHRARAYLIFRPACEVAGRAATCKRGRKFAHGASLAERRVVPSSKENSSCSKMLAHAVHSLTLSFG